MKPIVTFIIQIIGFAMISLLMAHSGAEIALRKSHSYIILTSDACYPNN